MTRLVEDDGERREQVSEDVLGREGHGDAADAEAREQGRDLDPEVVEDEEEDDGPHREPPHEGERADHGHGLRILARRRIDEAPHPEGDRGARPDPALDDDGDDGGAANHERHDRIEFEHERGGEEPHEEDEGKLRLAEHSSDEVVDRGPRLAREARERPQRVAFEQPQRERRDGVDAGGEQPG